MSTRKSVLVFIASIYISFLFAQTFPADKADNLLKKTEENTAFYETDFTAHYTIVQSKPGEGKTSIDADMYRRDKSAKWTILITGPVKDRGKGYLQFDGNIWFYDPADKRFTFTSSKDKFQGSNANNSDFMPQRYYSDFSIVAAETAKLGNFDCVLFTLEAKVDGVDYPKLRLWVTKDDGLVRKKEDYSLSGQLLRTTAIPSYQIIDVSSKVYSIPVNILIIDNLRGKKISGKMQYERTQITITNPAFKKVEDSVYTKPFLEMMGTR